MIQQIARVKLSMLALRNFVGGDMYLTELSSLVTQ